MPPRLPSNRLDWDTTWMQVARTIAQRSLCHRAQVGAVIVTPTNRVVAVGYNGPPAGFERTPASSDCRSWCTRAVQPNGELDPGYTDCPSLHAEANALSVCDRTQREHGTIYITDPVCFTCAKLIANSGLQTAVIRSSETAAHRNPERSFRFLESCGVTVVIMEDTAK